MKEIPLFFTFDRYYVIPATVAFHSLLKYASDKYMYRLYVLYADLKDSDRRLLKRVVDRFANASLSFIDVSFISLSDEIRKGKAYFSKEIYYKLIAADIFPQYDRIICSDVDVVFKGDVSPSYFMYENEFFYYAGVGTIVGAKDMTPYEKNFTLAEKQILKEEINAGYLLMNLKAMRENNIQKRLSEYYLDNYHRLVLPEQDCMALCCWPHVKSLPLNYLVCTGLFYHYRLDKNSIVFNLQNNEIPKERESQMKMLEDALLHPIQIHYAGSFKPWNTVCSTQQRYWFSMLKDAGCVGRYIAVLPLYIKQRMTLYSLKCFVKKMSLKIKRKMNKG